MADFSMKKPGWHGSKYYFGFHYDLHAGAEDTVLGTRCSPKELAATLRILKPDFVQTDCKGHPGYTSWFSKLPTASVPKGLKKDALRQWREATRELGVPLHCHYSGIWDRAAGLRFPEWTVEGLHGREDKLSAQNCGVPAREKMCPRGPYLDELMIPQMIELIDRYEVDGFWIDGDIWGVEPCYCPRCRAAFTEATGIVEPPREFDEPNWALWWNFTRQSFEEFVTRYTTAVHQHKPGVVVCSNWLQTFRSPGAPTVPTDWISGDNTHVYGLDASRYEARFISTRGKPWDIMLWSFYCSQGFGQAESPWAAKPAQMLMQEAAVTIALGGNVQMYANPGIRDGRLVPWHQRRLNEVRRFVKTRQAVCQGSETIPQIAVLHSETHLRNASRTRSLFWDVDIEPVAGAVYALLENHYGVDVLDEWALLTRLADFPAVVVPERHEMSEEMVQALKAYVTDGGKLILSGAETLARFGPKFLGVTKGQLKEKATYHIPGEDGSVPLYSPSWRLIKPTTAKSLASLGANPLLDEDLLPYSAATLHKVGRGRVAYIPASIFRDFQGNRYPLTRAFVGAVAKAAIGSLPIQVKAPVAVDVVLRKKGEQTIIHLINRLSGIPNQPNNGAIDEIPAIGPIVIEMKCAQKPASVRSAWSREQLEITYRKGRATITFPRVHIHEAIIIS